MSQKSQIAATKSVYQDQDEAATQPLVKPNARKQNSSESMSTRSERDVKRRKVSVVQQNIAVL